MAKRAAGSDACYVLSPWIVLSTFDAATLPALVVTSPLPNAYIDECIYRRTSLVYRVKERVPCRGGHKGASTCVDYFGSRMHPRVCVHVASQDCKTI